MARQLLRAFTKSLNRSTKQSSCKELSWKHHIKQVTTKISKMSGIMITARHYLSLRTLYTIYNALINPYVTYCNILWASTYSSRLQGVYKIQKKVVRIMTLSKYRQESRPLFLSLELLNYITYLS